LRVLFCPEEAVAVAPTACIAAAAAATKKLFIAVDNKWLFYGRGYAVCGTSYWHRLDVADGTDVGMVLQKDGRLFVFVLEFCWWLWMVDSSSCLLVRRC
jgi:hypothetical protein